MAKQFKLEDPGEGIHEVEVREVLISVGDSVEEGQNVLVVESDKAAVELPCPYSGVIDEIMVEEGQTAVVGDVLLTVDDADNESQPDKEQRDTGDGSRTREETAQPREQEAATEDPDSDAADSAAAAPEESDDRPSRKARKQEQRNDSESGEDGTDEKKRSGDHARDRKSPPVKAAPSARKLAKEKGIDLEDVEPTGAHGHIVKEDVVRAVERGSDIGTDADLDKRQPLRSIRRATARQTARAWSEIPHVTHQDEADITELERLRRRTNSAASEGDSQLTITAFALKAVASALIGHPRFNATFDADAEEIVLKRRYDINLALDSERGLLTPVIGDVDAKSVHELAEEIGEMSARVRSGEASKADLARGSFTITNVGGLGGTAFTPIINHPQVAILGLARARLKADVLGDLCDNHTEVRFMLPLMLAFDHRVNDGADAARFMNDVIAMLSDPEAFLLNVR